MPVHNRKEFTRNCLLSLRKQTVKSFRIIVVDDGSTDGTSQMIEKEFPEVVLLYREGDLWWTGATNLGVKWVLTNAYESDYVLTLNNDTTLPENYFRILGREIERFPNSLIGTVALDRDSKDRIVEAGVSLNWLTAKYSYHSKNGSYEELCNTNNDHFCPTCLPGRGTAIPCRVFSQIGLYDEQTFPHYGADYDFSLRAQKAGYSLVVSYRLCLYCYPQLSGLANTDKRVPFFDFIDSLKSIRSANRIDRRIAFAKRHAPKHLFLSFCSFDIIRVVGGTLIRRTKLS